MLIITGKDGTEAFEDVGHSDEARALLPKMLVGEIEGGAVSPYHTLIYSSSLQEKLKAAAKSAADSTKHAVNAAQAQGGSAYVHSHNVIFERGTDD
jgi:cytochrome b involved in lipid metabolism